MRIVKPSKVLIMSFSKNQLKDLLFYEFILGSTGYWMFKYDKSILFEATGLAGSIALPLIAKRIALKRSRFMFTKNRIITVN